MDTSIPQQGDSSVLETGSAAVVKESPVDSERVAQISPWILNNFHHDQSYTSIDRSASASPLISLESVTHKPSDQMDNLTYISHTLQIPLVMVNRL